MKAFQTMKSMELDDEDKYDAPAIDNVKPDYPYGLRICLTEKEFEKLGLDPRDAVKGAIFHGHFLACVTNVMHIDGDGGQTCRVESQIQYLDIESEDEEDADE